MILKVGRGIDHAEHFDDSLDPVQRPQLSLQCGEHRQAHRSRGGHTLFFGQVLAHTSGDELTVCSDGPLAGNVGQIVQNDHRAVSSGGGGGRGQNQSEFFHSGVDAHADFLLGGRNQKLRQSEFVKTAFTRRSDHRN